MLILSNPWKFFEANALKGFKNKLFFCLAMEILWNVEIFRDRSFLETPTIAKNLVDKKKFNVKLVSHFWFLSWTPPVCMGKIVMTNSYSRKKNNYEGRWSLFLIELEFVHVLYGMQSWHYFAQSWDSNVSCFEPKNMEMKLIAPCLGRLNWNFNYSQLLLPHAVRIRWSAYLRKPR